MKLVQVGKKDDKGMREVVAAAHHEAKRKLSFMRELGRRQAISNAAAIRRHAKERGWTLEYHPSPWIFVARSGEGVSMLAGHFAIIDGVLHQLIAV